MSVITISRGSYSHGQEIAEKVANRLGYNCISRDCLIEASKEFNIPEIKLFRAIHDASTIMDRFLTKKEKYIAYIQLAILKNLTKDNVVYHGFAGHFFVKEIPHVFKIRIVADMEERISIMRERNGVSRKEAIKYIYKLDKQRQKWSQQLYGIETSDPSLYDLVINIGQLGLNSAVEIICHNIGLKRFQNTPESNQKMKDLCIAAETKALLIDLKPNIKVMAQNGLVRVWANTTENRKIKLEKEMKKIARAIPGLTNLQVDSRMISSLANNYL